MPLDDNEAFTESTESPLANKAEKKKLTLVVLAGGTGTRFGGPKQFQPLGYHKETLLEYSIFDAIESGFDCVIIVVRRHSLANHMDGRLERLRKSIDITCIYQDDFAKAHNAARNKPWGTAHAILSAAQTITGDFAVINADDYYGKHSIGAIANFLNLNNGDHAMVGFPIQNTLSDHGDVSRGICVVDTNSNLKEIDEYSVRFENGIVTAKNKLNNTEAILENQALASMNIWGFRNSIRMILESAWMDFFQMNKMEKENEFLITTVMNSAIGKDLLKCQVLETKDRWFGLTHRGDLKRVEKEIAYLHESGQYPSPLFR